MSSKRGRKRNDNLPPNRARDVQRAFRARRAAHLEALEQRVAELEEENNALRAALALPPANRLPLGKGPTGKDKPKSGAHQASSASGPSSLPSLSALPHLSPTSSLPSGSRTDSPSSNSTRTHSLSPTGMNASLGHAPNPLPNIDSGWDDPMFMPKEQPEAGSSSQTTSYTVPPVPGPSSHSPSYSSSNRQAMEDMYMPMSSNYSSTVDRPMSGATDIYSGSSSGFLLRDERRTFSYSQPSFPTHANHMHAHSSPASAVSPTMPPPTGGLSMQSPVQYAHRRSITEPHGYRSAMGGQIPSIPQMRLPQPTPHPLRIPSPSQLAGNGAPSQLSGYDVSGERRMDRSGMR